MAQHLAQKGFAVAHVHGVNVYTGGKTTTHALGLLEPRGVLFTGIQQEVYTGMIIGECSRDGEMEVGRGRAPCTLCSLPVPHLQLPAHVDLGMLTLSTPADGIIVVIVLTSCCPIIMFTVLLTREVHSESGCSLADPRLCLGAGQPCT